MSLFNGKILEARYMDTEYSVVEVLYEGDDGKVYSYALRPDSENQEWKNLVADGWDQDKLIEKTVEYKRVQGGAFATQVNAAAKALVDQLLAQKTETQSDIDVLAFAKLNIENANAYEKRKETELEGTNIYNFIIDKNSDKDELFKFKMWALDLDFVKSKDTEIKSSLRKVQTILEGLSMLNSLK